jgi:hypothetical protein
MSIQITINNNTQAPKARTLLDQDCYITCAIIQAIFQNNADEVIKLIIDFFVDYLEEGIAFALEMSWKSYPEVFDRLCFEALSKDQLLTKVFTLFTQRNKSACLEACLKHIPNVKYQLQLCIQPFCVEERKISYASLLVLYKHECISWDENNVLYKHLNHTILNQANCNVTEEMKELCKASYKLYSSSNQLTKTYAADFVAKIAKHA